MWTANVLGVWLIITYFIRLLSELFGRILVIALTIVYIIPVLLFVIKPVPLAFYIMASVTGKYDNFTDYFRYGSPVVLAAIALGFALIIQYSFMRRRSYLG